MKACNFLIATIILCLLIIGLQAQDYDFIVARDGSGDFSKIQEAIHAVPDFRKQAPTIYIKRGTYKEKLILSASKTD